MFPDERWGEVPMVLLTCTGAVEPVLERLAGRARRDLARFKRPKYAVVRTEPLPRTFSGKVAKPDLRKAYPTVPADAMALRVSTHQIA